MSLWLLLSFVGLACGTALLLAEISPLGRPPLARRIGPYLGGGQPVGPAPGVSTLEILLPGLGSALQRLERLLGIDASLAERLDRAGLSVDPDRFRLRQVTHALLAVLSATALVVVARPTVALSGIALLGAPACALLVHEERIARATKARNERVLVELPVVTEQLAMLVDAGHSLSSALARVAARADGVVASELARVDHRVAQGLSQNDALAEWAARSGLDPVRRLVKVLALHSDAGDLGALIAEESRTIRAEAHRTLIEELERRAQMVWIPVTVATLVPGLIFLAVPFIAAMSQVVGG